MIQLTFLPFGFLPDCNTFKCQGKADGEPLQILVVQRVNSFNHWINQYPLANSIDVNSTCLLDSDFSSG